MAYTTAELIYSCYTSAGRYSPNTLYFVSSRNVYPTMTIEKSKAFTKYIKVDLDKDIIEIPCIYKYPVGQALADNNRLRQDNAPHIVDTLYIPMSCLEEDPRQSKTSSTLLRKFFYDTAPVMNLCRKRTPNETYLGGEGIILYDDFTPLIMMSLVVKREKARIEGTYSYTPISQVVHLNPIIYSKDDMLAKYIRTKFIAALLSISAPPTYLSRYKLRNPSGIYNNNQLPWKFTIIIDDFSDFFVTPKVPDAKFSNEDINHLLSDNIDIMLK